MLRHFLTIRFKFSTWTKPSGVVTVVVVLSLLILHTTLYTFLFPITTLFSLFIFRIYFFCLTFFCRPTVVSVKKGRDFRVNLPDFYLFFIFQEVLSKKCGREKLMFKVANKFCICLTLLLHEEAVLVFSFIKTEIF